jgi:cytochrome P450
MLIGEIIDVPRLDRIQFRDWALPVLNTTGYTKHQLYEVYTRLRGYIVSLVACKREQPSNDLLSTFVRAQTDERLTEQGVVNMTVARW